MNKNFRVKHKNGRIGWKRGQVVGECGQAGAWVKSEGELYQGTGSDSEGPLYSKITVYDNGGRSLDRYTVYFTPTECLSMSPDPFFPLGVCLYGEGKTGPHNGEEIKFSELPEDCRRAVMNTITGKL